MVVKFSSFDGGLMTWRLLLDNTLNQQTETTAFLEAGTHDRIVYAVQKGLVDAGTVRTDTLERMQSEGKIDINRFSNNPSNTRCLSLCTIHPIVS